MWIQKITDSHDPLLHPFIGTKLALPDLCDFDARVYATWHNANSEAKASAETAYEKTPISYEWVAAFALFDSFGSLDVNKNGNTLPKADVTKEGLNVPFAVKRWVINTVSDYISPFLDLKNYKGGSPNTPQQPAP